jgi:hypothetical protein
LLHTFIDYVTYVPVHPTDLSVLLGTTSKQYK